MDRYDNFGFYDALSDGLGVVEAYRLDRYDNSVLSEHVRLLAVVEAYRLDRYDNKLLL